MRSTYTLNRWNFSIPSMNYTEKVTVPHTWNVEPEVMLHKGAAVYETSFEAPADKADEEVFLQFNAVYHSARVFVNGHPAGDHARSGYTPFRMRVTPFVNFGSENTVRVEVDNTHRDDMLPHGDDFDWADDGGLIRRVFVEYIPVNGFDYIHVTEDLTEMHSAGSDSTGNSNIRSGNAGNGNAGCDRLGSGTLKIEAPALRGEKKAVRLTVADYMTYEQVIDTEIPDFDGTAVVPFEDLKLWSCKSPNLYIVTLIAEDDIISARIGLRKLETRGTKVLLNGEEIYLKSCEWMPGSHPDFGMAEPLTHSIKCLSQLKQAGCVFTRFHWQQDDSLFDWCDENGLMVQEEIPYWGFPKQSTLLQHDIAKQHADEMVRFHYNHPSIVCWGVGNELDADKPETITYVKTLIAYFKSMDSRRLVNYVSNSLSRVQNAEKDDGTLYGDIAMWNEYLTLWEPSDDVPAHIRRTCKKAADRNMPVFVSEFGLCEPAFPGGDPRRAEILKERLEIYGTIDNLVGYMWFSLNDYRTHMGEAGEGRMKQRVHGSTDLYCNEKPSYRVLCELQK